MNVLDAKRALEEVDGRICAWKFGDDDDPDRWAFVIILGPENIAAFDLWHDALVSSEETGLE